MSIQYKFRSCVNFETLEIDPHPSITVRDLKAEIARLKKLNPSLGGFDLHLFHSVTGEVYNDDDYNITSGTSVIVKRVPAGMVPSPITEHVNLNDKLKKRETNFDSCPGYMFPPVEDLHDFGDNFYQIPKTPIADSDAYGT